MNLTELNGLVVWVKKEIEEKQILQKYGALVQILNQHIQPNQQKPPFETQKNDLLDTLRSMPINKLTKSQIEFLKNLGIFTAIGELGAEIIEENLYRNVIDIATSIKNINEIRELLKKGIAKSTQIRSGLDGCVFKEEYENKEEVLIRVSFTGNASMLNIKDFKSWGNAWYEIGRGISMAHNNSPEDIKIVGASQGSIIIELAAAASIATTTSVIILSALKVAEKVLDIRKKAEEIKNLKLKNKKLANDIKKEAENEKQHGIEYILNEIIAEIKLNTDKEGDKITALEKAIKNLVNFIESGGEVDFVIPEQDEKNENNEKQPDFDKLRVTFNEIRELEQKVKLIESSLEPENKEKETEKSN